jgi:hypothetical protein
MLQPEASRLRLEETPVTIACLKALSFIGLFLLALPAAAQSLIVTEDELAPDRFPEVAETIRANLDPLGLSPARHEQVLRLLQRMEARIAEDPARYHRRIRHEQKRLNSVLAPAMTVNQLGANVVCKPVKPVGSRIPFTECRDRLTMETEERAAESLTHRPRTTH